MQNEITQLNISIQPLHTFVQVYSTIAS